MAGFLNHTQSQFDGLITQEFPGDKSIIEQAKAFQKTLSTIGLKTLQTIVGINNLKFCLVPKSIFDPEKAATFLHFVTEKEAERVIRYDWLADIDAYLVYSINKEKLNTINSLWPNNKVFHAFSGLIESQAIHSIRQDQKCCYINIANNTFTITVLEGRSLIFFNGYQFQNEADIVYYTLFSLEQIGLLPHKLKLYVSGNIQKNNAVWNGLHTYIQEIAPIQLSGNFNYSKDVLDHEPHQYYNLFSQFLCV